MLILVVSLTMNDCAISQAHSAQNVELLTARVEREALTLSLLLKPFFSYWLASSSLYISVCAYSRFAFLCYVWLIPLGGLLLSEEQQRSICYLTPLNGLVDPKGGHNPQVENSHFKLLVIMVEETLKTL